MKKKATVLLVLLPALVYAQSQGDFGILDETQRTFFTFIREGFKLLLVSLFLGTIGFGVFLLVKKTRSAIAYAKQSGDEDPTMAGVKAAIPWGIGLFLFAVFMTAILDMLLQGQFRRLLLQVLGLEGGGLFR